MKDDIVYLNGAAQARVSTGEYNYVDVRGCVGQPMNEYEETLGEVKHTTLQTTMYGMHMRDMPPTKVPEGHYFYMGDNRDNSADGRVWGFVPREYIRGKAIFVWLSFDPCQSGGMPGLGSPGSSGSGRFSSSGAPRIEAPKRAPSAVHCAMRTLPLFLLLLAGCPEVEKTPTPRRKPEKKG